MMHVTSFGALSAAHRVVRATRLAAWTLVAAFALIGLACLVMRDFVPAFGRRGDIDTNHRPAVLADAAADDG